MDRFNHSFNQKMINSLDQVKAKILGNSWKLCIQENQSSQRQVICTHYSKVTIKKLGWKQKDQKTQISRDQHQVNNQADNNNQGSLINPFCIKIDRANYYVLIGSKSTFACSNNWIMKHLQANHQDSTKNSTNCKSEGNY